MKKAFFFLLVLLMPLASDYAQNDSTAIEITIIDSYITPETPHKFVLSFFTSDSCLSSLNIDGKYNFKVSEKLTDNHKIEVDMSGLTFDSLLIRYSVIAISREGKEYTQSFETTLSDEGLLVKNKDLNLFNVCCIGGTFFGLPSPGVIFDSGEKYLSLSKEIPLFSFYSGGYNYPTGYFGIEYKYVDKFHSKHLFSVGYKQVFQVPVIEFISPGAGYLTNFNGNYGFSLETTIGLFRFYYVFTLFSRYRYSSFLGEGNGHFHEISIGLYSNFFSLNL